MLLTDTPSRKRYRLANERMNMPSGLIWGIEVVEAAFKLFECRECDDSGVFDLSFGHEIRA